MNKDNHLMFEAYASKFFKSEPFNSEDCEDQAGVVDWRLNNKQTPTHEEHGRRAAAWELHSGEKVKNPHQPGSDKHREWQFGYDQEKSIKKEEASEEKSFNIGDVITNGEEEYQIVKKLNNGGIVIIVNGASKEHTTPMDVEPEFFSHFQKVSNEDNEIPDDADEEEMEGGSGYEGLT